MHANTDESKGPGVGAGGFAWPQAGSPLPKQLVFRLNSLIDWIDVPTFGGGTGRYDFVYEEADTAYSCPFAADDPSNLTLRAPFLTSIIPPTGSPYSMPITDYNIVPPPPPVLDGFSCDYSSGLIRGITLPTMGRIEWDYLYF